MIRAVMIAMALTGCVATQEKIVYKEVQRECPPLPGIRINPTPEQTTQYAKRVVEMYAQCAKGKEP